ncbi:hypothetical protein CTAM01_05868 [Colletotrichum tamarilloi]|uniref:TMEM205-like domain-containing protein n=1 Tax=Colletotrichum tamarilloi TaxID=1209934 RepID=A0ABQ9RDQ8_9PEZI|nr:uncharacterized protein CTAM01_05868 [Colletotrichum tamarilloi]KAK1501644.1 hypothetical protein CTAM01_05868 [Colletotrichum tamarilloi]
MSDSIAFSPGPYHIISYGALLGTTFFHVSHHHNPDPGSKYPNRPNKSFVNGITMFRVLERPAFATAQNALFPVYFTIQTALPALMALTYPGSRSLLGEQASSITGLLQESNRYTALLPIATMFLTGLVNLAVVLPKTVTVMKARYAQEKKDGKKSYDAAPHSQEMQALNKSFGKLHGISTLINLAGFIAMIQYGFSLAARLD